MNHKSMGRPQVSICIPTYNGAAYLKECLASIQAQTFRDFEVIIVDDDSADETPAIAAGFVQQDLRFHFHSNPKRLGLVGNWNRCLDFASGEWIKFVFQDDLLRPSCLERMMETARQKNSLFLACRRDFHFDEQVTPERRGYYAASAANIDSFFKENSTMPPELFVKAIVGCVGANFIGEPTVTCLHRDLITRCGRFNENLIMCCDSEYWYRAGTQVPVTYIPEALAVFRVHSHSTSADNFERRCFRMDLLDPWIVLHEFIHNPHYETLRQTAAKYFGRDHLIYLSRSRARLAWNTLRRVKNLNSAAASLCQQEWESVCKNYPALPACASRSKFKEQIWSLKCALRTAIGKLLRKARLRN